MVQGSKEDRPIGKTRVKVRLPAAVHILEDLGVEIDEDRRRRWANHGSWEVRQA